MAASILNSVGVGMVPIGATAAAPAVLIDFTGTYAASAAGGAEAFTITNTDTTNWLWVRVNRITATPFALMPGQTWPFVEGINSDAVKTIWAWGTAPATNGTPGAAAAIQVVGGPTKGW